MQVLCSVRLGSFAIVTTSVGLVTEGVEVTPLPVYDDWFIIIVASQEWEYAATEATPQECNTAIQECLNYINTTSDSTSSYRRSEINVNDVKNLHSYIFMEVGFDKSSNSDSEYTGSSDYSASKVKFVNAYKKELQDVKVVWSANKHFMTEQFTEFSRWLNIVAEKVSVPMGDYIEEQQEKWASWNSYPRQEIQLRGPITNPDGSINTIAKDWADKLAKFDIKRASEAINKFETDWTTMFSWIDPRTIMSWDTAMINAEQELAIDSFIIHFMFTTFDFFNHYLWFLYLLASWYMVH